ncbi:MAG: ferrous iron transport protein B [Bacteroidetes bacterium 4572_112]|nr:MAG: ferrous iron transport protein B [Bacteroidetes bacterium 4572_112]
MYLSELKEGEKGIISKVKGRGAFRRRIMEMGFVTGKEIEVIRRAPLQDPIEYSLMGYDVSLRVAEAELIEMMSKSDVKSKEFDYKGTIKDDSGLKTNDHKHKELNVAFVGNPNCGKTTIFNIVSGMNEHVGNYSGVTVDSKEASFKHGDYKINVVDLPGTYSLTAYSPEELYVRNFIHDNMPDVVINVVDSSNLERNLYLTTQLIDMDIKVVMALNMSDEMDRRKDVLDDDLLSQMLGIPSVRTVGAKAKGIDELFDLVIESYLDKNPVERHIHINYGKCLEKSIRMIQDLIKRPENWDLTDRISSRFLAIKLFEGDNDAQQKIKQAVNEEEIKELVAARQKRAEEYFKENAESAITDAKYGFIDGALKETYKVGATFSKRDVTHAIDSFITNKLYSFPLFIFLMWIMFQATFFVGSYPQSWIESGVGLLSDFISGLMSPGLIRDLLVDGIIGGVGSVISFLPNILILFFFISIMEDTGYMARVAFIVDKIMHKVGLHGRSFIPLLMGFGCNVPAIMATRTIEGRNDRLVTMLINPFMSCSARLPVYVVIISAFFPQYPGTMLFFIYTLGIMMAGVVAWIFKKTLFKAKELPFVMELPPYRVPTALTIVKHMWFKAEMYLKKMAGIILVASVLIWALGYFPREIDYSRDYNALQNEMVQTAEQNQNIDTDSLEIVKTKISHKISLMKEGERQEKSYIGMLGHFIEPTIRPLGFDWKIGVSLITGAAAKEIVVSTMGVLYQTDPDAEGTQSLGDRLKAAVYTSGPKMGQKIYTPPVAFGFLLFVLFYFPCIATIAAIKRESGLWKYAIFEIVYTTAIAWVAAFAAYQIGSLFY